MLAHVIVVLAFLFLFYSNGEQPGGRDPSDEPCGAVNFLCPTSNAIPGEACSTKIMGDVASP
jgi:hypothetical protein